MTTDKAPGTPRRGCHAARYRTPQPRGDTRGDTHALIQKRDAFSPRQFPKATETTSQHSFLPIVI
ncbi:hypothetical protein E2C01_046892 [Portunus trituberculatus]|uniref:Uncharacterized protein n=1 Tax=Portunus trituberculatus TaxID=210409 RepID=A0A5B7G608_PORTR|nr:hypothetical protein [Portunus trituberculatus]